MIFSKCLHEMTWRYHSNISYSTVTHTDLSRPGTILSPLGRPAAHIAYRQHRATSVQRPIPIPCRV